jgi:probable phosphoglycerate mutase
MRLYIIRHGDPDYATDSLTAAGQVEAEALGNFMGKLQLDRLYSSPLGRARQTAAYIAEAGGLEISTLDWTRELHYQTIADGLSYLDIHGHLVRRAEYLENPSRWEMIPELAAIPIDEISRGMIDKSDEFFASLGYERQNGSYRVSQPNTLKVAVVCHQGFGLLWLSHLLAIPSPLMWAGFFLHTTSITTILFDERTPGVATPRCIGLGELPHLHCDQIPPSTMGIKANYW